MAKQFAFKQVFRNCCTIDRDKRASPPIACLMQPLSEQFFTGPARAEQHDRDISRRDTFYRTGNLGHFRRGGDHRAQDGLVLANLLREAPILLFDLAEAQGAIYYQAQFVDIDRFLVEIICSQFNSLESTFTGPVPRSDNDLGVGLHLHDCIKDREAFGRSIGIRWQSKIECHDGGLLAAERSKGLIAVARDDHLIIIIGPFQLRLQSFVILDDQ